MSAMLKAFGRSVLSPLFSCPCSPWRGRHLGSFTLRRSHLSRLEVSRGHTASGSGVLGLLRQTKGTKSSKVTELNMDVAELPALDTLPVGGGEGL